ncbi:class I SAM-dependent methyltransferase [Roseomonas sp. CCTCC AB2023176]|uniref:class I SAM-dependent methyltransferase n=1 Tax=Roseomonas sp. CCTCC AB2023176 TaxID=3342640 RepID=UPI0035D6F92B
MDDDLSTSWKRADFSQQMPQALQRLEEFRAGQRVPVFDSFVQAMRTYVPSGASLSFLDCACTAGYYLDVAKASLPHRLDWMGTDIAEAALRQALSRHPGGRWAAASLTALPFAEASFDVVMASGVLEHVPAWEAGLLEVGRVARRFVILHRLPVSRDGRFRPGTMTMYGVPTTRHAMPFHAVNALLAARGFLLVGSLDTYGEDARGPAQLRLQEQTAVYRRFALA